MIYNKNIKNLLKSTFYGKNIPQEMNNLIDDPRYLKVKVELRKALFASLAEDGEHSVPYTKKYSRGAVLRHGERSKAAEFPDDWLRSGDENDLRRFFTPDDRQLKRGNS